MVKLAKTIQAVAEVDKDISTQNKIWVHWVPNDKIEAVSIHSINQLLLSFLWFIITKLEFNIFI